MITGFDVVSKIRDYVEGKLSLESFRDWVVSSQIEIEESEGKLPVDHNAERLLADIEGHYAEVSDKIVSDGLWKEQMRALIAPHPESVQLGLVYFYQDNPSPQSDLERWGTNITSTFSPNFQPLGDFACQH